MKRQVPDDPGFGPKDAQLPFHDAESSGALPPESAKGQTTPGTSGRPPPTEPPVGQNSAVDDAEFLSDEFDINPGEAAELALSNRTAGDPDAVRDHVIARQKDEEKQSFRNAPLPEQSHEPPDHPNTMKKPVLNRTNRRAGAG